MNFITKALAVVWVCAVPSNAQAIIVWDGTANDVVPNGNQTIAQVTTFTTGSGFQSPSQGANYYPASANGGDEDPDFYASKDNVAVTGFSIFDGGQNDLLGRVQVHGTTSGTGISSMFAWNAEPGVLSSFAMTGWGGFGNNVSNAGMRFVFQDGGNNWFASDEFTVQAGTISDPSSANWFSFTPHTSGIATIGSASTPSSFNNLNLVGYYQEFDTTGGGGVFSTGFSATFIAVPEASQVAAFALLTCGCLGYSHIKRRRKA